MPYIEAKNLENFKEWTKGNLEDIRKKRFVVITTEDNEVFVLPTVATPGLLRPFITNLTDKQMEDIRNWFKEREVEIRECKHIYLDSRKDPRETKKED